MEKNNISKTKSESERLLREGDFNLEIICRMPIESSLLGEKTESTFIEEYSFRVTYEQYSGSGFDTLPERPAAKGSFRIFNAELAMNSDADPASVFDSSADNASIYAAFYEYGTYDFSEELFRMNGLEDIMGSNLAHLDRLELEPEFLGKGLGEVVLECLCGWLQSKAAFVAFKSFPLQFEHKGPETPQRKMAQDKLDRHYQNMGFSKLKLPDDYINQDDSLFILNSATKGFGI